jgi:hypothetical protein
VIEGRGRRFFIHNLLFIISHVYDVIVIGGASAGLTADRRVLMNV